MKCSPPALQFTRNQRIATVAAEHERNIDIPHDIHHRRVAGHAGRIDLLAGAGAGDAKNGNDRVVLILMGNCELPQKTILGSSGRLEKYQARLEVRSYAEKGAEGQVADLPFDN